MDPTRSVHATRSLMPGSRPIDGRLYLLVLDGEKSSVVHLPDDGLLTVGRDDHADVRLTDDSASRQHARLVLSGGRAQVSDLDSHNGTRVNGELLEEGRALSVGDVITIGSAHLIIQGRGALVPSKSLVAADVLRAELAREIERALAYHRAVSVCTLVTATADDQRRTIATMSSRLRGLDVVATDGPGRTTVVLPELGGEGARDWVQQVLDDCGELDVRAGLAAAPEDACDADALLAAARLAATQAGRGAVRTTSALKTTRAVGDVSVVVAESSMVQTWELLERLAASEITVLICGETGTGKEIAARAVHHHSKRCDGPFVALNCAALPESLLESELFGHEKGAFTGATSDKRGLLEAGDGGTVFLDEVGELSPTAQAKLLRALETRTFTRVGGTTERHADVRIVAATHRDLQVEVEEGRFREDLFFRISTATVVLPPLRERPREIVLLARSFLEAACKQSGRDPLKLSRAALTRLATYEWPGNIRELKNAMEYAAAVASGGLVEPADLGPRVAPADDAKRGDAPRSAADDGRPEEFQPLSEEVEALERRRIREALAAADGVQTRAAKLIGMPLRTFVYKLKKYGLREQK